MPSQTAAYRFGRFHLLPSERALLVDGERAKLGGRAYDLLMALVERRGRTVSREELFELVWPGRIVEDQNLKTQVLALRKVLGPQAIATIPGRGYRFALPLDDARPSAAATPSPSKSPVAVPLSNLPSEQSPLHGRVADIVAVLRLLSEYRLVTVAGAAGVGKTRLAQAVAHQLRSRYRDGVWIVELAPVADGALVASTVARVLGFPSGKDIGTVDGAARAFSTLSLLLVLDNCEHLVAAISEFASAVLKSAPNVSLLATSQEPLRLRGEQVFRLDTLAVPPDGATPQAGTYGAVSLFVERAHAANSHFELTNDNASAVIEVCRRLDGIPLALELAAARVPLLGVDGIRARLNERFRLLTSGSRGAPTRHQTLASALDWSHGLLSTEAQTVFRRLGVFAGSFSLDAARQVAANETLDEWAVLDHLGELVDKSLVLAEGRDRPRYRLFESTRAYALEALARAGETVDVRRRHAEAIARLFDRADDMFMRVPTMQWLTELAPDLDNWREALTFSLNNDPATAIALATSATSFLASAGFTVETARACERVAPLLERHATAAAQARYWLALAYLGGYAVVSVPQALEAAKKAAAGFRQAGDPLRLYRALHLLSQHADLIGEHESIGPADDEMQRIESPDWPLLLTRLRRQGIARRHRREGRIAEYRDGYAAEAKLCAQAGDERAAWILQNHVALAEITLGNLEHAIEVARGTVEQIRERGMQREFWGQLVLYARVMVEKGDPDAALPAVRDAIAVLRPQGALWWLGDHLAWLVAQRGEWTNAARLHGWVDARATEHNAPRGPVVKVARDRLHVQLEAALEAGELTRLMQEGGELNEAHVAALVLGEME
jgi:predicted ATPase/DNA-binding winged helix-turn-helix (wHTH) protein